MPMLRSIYKLANKRNCVPTIDTYMLNFNFLKTVREATTKSFPVTRYRIEPTMTIDSREVSSPSLPLDRHEL